MSKSGVFIYKGTKSKILLKTLKTRIYRDNIDISYFN